MKKKMLLTILALIAVSVGLHAQSLKERALIYKYVINDKAPGVHTTFKNGVKIWTNSNGDNLGEYKYSITQSEKKQADKIREKAIDEIAKKTLKDVNSKEAHQAVTKKLREQKEAKNKKKDNSKVENVFDVNTTD